MEMKCMERVGCRNGLAMIRITHPMEASLMYEVPSFGCTGAEKDAAEARVLTPVKIRTLRQYFDTRVSQEARILLGKFRRDEDGVAYFRVMSNTQLSKKDPEEIKALQILIRESATGPALDLLEMEKSLDDDRARGARFTQLRANTTHSLRAHWAISYRIYDMGSVVSSPEELVTAYMLARAASAKNYDYSHGYFKKTYYDDLAEKRKSNEIEQWKRMEQRDLFKLLGNRPSHGTEASIA